MIDKSKRDKSVVDTAYPAMNHNPELTTMLNYRRLPISLRNMLHLSARTFVLLTDKNNRAGMRKLHPGGQPGLAPAET